MTKKRDNGSAEPGDEASSTPAAADDSVPAKKVAHDPGEGREHLSETGEARPSAGDKFRIVGIGASAGGLHSLEGFFRNLPGDTGLAFVVIQHLLANHESIMAELLGRHTDMSVQQVTDAVTVQPNHVYLIAPNSTLTLRGDRLHVETPADPIRRRSPIDRFFASLGEERGEHAVGIVLTGAGSDGTLGIRTIKEHGGVTMAQAGAEHPSMPQHAIATGVVDFVLPVEEMPRALLNFLKYHETVKRERLPDILDEIRSKLGELAALLQRKTGHDFSQYKPNTIIRRTQRRMQVLQIESFDEYLDVLREGPTEVESLFRDLLIGVTYFFRDKEAFAHIERMVIPAIFEGKGEDDHVRVWVPGCATGEESYSLAILLREQMERMDDVPNVHVFASDIDDEALNVGREGLYGPAVAEQVSPKRVERFFMKSAGGFRVNKDLRDMCLFAEHNLIKDPPFSRLDLVSCRNVLIYMDSELQRKLMQLFHHALLPDGFLFLGPSERVSGHTDLFEAVEKGTGLFRRKGVVSSGGPHFPLMETQFQLQRKEARERRTHKPPDLAHAVDRMLLTQYGPPCVVVNSRNEVMYYSGNTGRYLQLPQGQPTNDVLEMARRGLRTSLRSTLFESMKSQSRVVHEGLTVGTNGGVEVIDLIVQPLGVSGHEPELFVVVFRPGAGATKDRHAKPLSDSAEGRAQGDSVDALEEELASTRKHLQSTIEELESSNEELRSMNEELLSMNEELQSSNEEVETNREELQSVNEELETVNAELAHKVEELARAHDDLKNLFDSTQIATIFLDNHLHIKGFTPATTEILRLIEGDIGRPLTDIASRFALGDLAGDVKKVLQTLAPSEREVKVASAEDSWHLMRILPYRTHENVINGVVITFVDLSAIKRAEESRSRLAAIVESSADPIIGTNTKGNIVSWNAAAEALFGYTANEVFGQPILMIVPKDHREEEIEVLNRIQRGEPIGNMETVRLAKDGRRIDVSLSASPVFDADRRVVGKASIVRDITQRKRRDEHQRLLLDELDHRVKNTLAMVSALCSQAAGESTSLDEFRTAFEGRIRALANAHRQLSQARWHGADLKPLLHEILAPHLAHDGRNVGLDGPTVTLSPKITVTLALVLHELSTNAVKYGALADNGTLHIQWDIVASSPDDLLRMVWTERCAEQIKLSDGGRTGFGTMLIRQSVEYELGGQVDMQLAAKGLTCTIDIPWTRETGTSRDDLTSARQREGTKGQE